MKTKVLDFIDHLLLYDYLLFGGIVLLFILILVLAIVLRHRLGVAVLLVFAAFGLLTLGSVAGYTLMHRYLFSNEIVVSEAKALEFTEALLIKGEIRNTSKRAFTECTVNAGVHKVTHNRYIDRLYPYVPFQKSTLKVRKTIEPGKNSPFKLFVEPFRYRKDFNVTVKADCR